MGCKSGCSCGRLSACALGFAVGVTWALGVVVLGILAWQFNHGQVMVTTLSSVYWGYAGTAVGIGFGAFWGFIDGFIGGLVIGLIYNFWVKHCPCKNCSSVCSGNGKTVDKIEVK